MIYLVDSNCFMDASRFHYPFDIAESFWKKLSEAANNHLFYSIDKVHDEIFENEDALSNWCSDNLPEDFFISTNTTQIWTQYGKLVNWATEKIQKGLKESGLKKFINETKADIFFVALASLDPDKYTVVTDEISAVSSKKDIKLPDACSAFNIRSINFIEMLRELQIKF